LIRLAARQPTWALGFQDEVWWSCLAQPALSSWAAPDQPLRLVERAVAADDPDPKALACSGLLVRAAQPDGSWQEWTWLRFVDGRPVSAVTIEYLAWCAAKLVAAGYRALLLVWDTAPWHVSRVGRIWLQAHNRQVKATGQGVRIHPLLSAHQEPLAQSHRAQVGAWQAPGGRARLLPANELIDRVCAAFDCDHEPHLAIHHDAA
jgi:hypothetical protein